MRAENRMAARAYRDSLMWSIAARNGLCITVCCSGNEGRNEELAVARLPPLQQLESRRQLDRGIGTFLQHAQRSRPEPSPCGGAGEGVLAEAIAVRRVAEGEAE